MRCSGRRRVAAGLLLVGALTLVGIIPAEAQKNEITIGSVLSLTGRFSGEATDAQKGYDLFIEETNARGGILVKSAGKRLPLKLVQYDDQSDASTAAKLYERLITADRVDLVFGPWGSGHNFAVTAVTEKHRYPVVTASAAADSIFTRGFKHVFNTTDLASNLPKPLAAYLTSRQRDLKSVAILYENFLFTATLNDVLTRELKAAGVNVTLNEKYSLGARDFTGVMTKVKSLAPDALVILNIMPSSIYATRQMREVDFAPRFFSVVVGPMYTKEFIEGLGQQSEGVVELGFWHADLPYPGAKDFDTRFAAKYGRLPSTDAAFAYTAAQILTQAIEKAGTLDREKINETLHREEFSSINGKVKYDERGVNVHSAPFLSQVQNGKRVIVWPPELTKNQLRFPVFTK